MKVPLDGTAHVYARVLEPPLFAFYDSKSEINLPIEEILSRSILFTIWVMKHAVTSGRWEIVGNIPLEEHLRGAPRFFKQDALHPGKFYIYNDEQDIPVAREACIGLERAAVWEPEHVEERLRDHYAGRVNRWVTSLQLPD